MDVCVDWWLATWRKKITTNPSAARHFWLILARVIWYTETSFLQASNQEEWRYRTVGRNKTPLRRKQKIPKSIYTEYPYKISKWTRQIPGLLHHHSCSNLLWPKQVIVFDQRDLKSVKSVKCENSFESDRNFYYFRTSFQTSYGLLRY